LWVLSGEIGGRVVVGGLGGSEWGGFGGVWGGVVGEAEGL